MTKQEQQHLGKWVGDLSRPKYNPIINCVANLWNTQGYKNTDISVRDFLKLVEECIKENGGDTDEQLKKIGFYKGEYLDQDTIQEDKKNNDKGNDQEQPYRPRNTPKR